MKFDDVLREIGEFGPYQKRVYFLATLPVILSAFEGLNMVFTFFIPPHRCAIPGYPDDQYQIINSTHAAFINASIPMDEDKEGQWSQCLIYNDVNYDDILSNHSDVHVGSLGSRNTSTCNRWVYDHSIFEATVPSDFNIVCDRKVLRASSNMVVEIGGLVGTLVCGIIADRMVSQHIGKPFALHPSIGPSQEGYSQSMPMHNPYAPTRFWNACEFGRKIPFYIGGLAMIAGGFGIAFVTNMITLNICRFLMGVARKAIWTNGLVIGMEIVGPSKRVFAGVVIELMWCLGMMLLLVIAYLIRHWRYLEIVLSIPSVGLLAYWCLLPESPRWLASQGRDKEAVQILEKIASSNKTELPKVDDIKNLLETEKSLSLRHVFKSRELFIRMLIVFSNMTVVIIIYYALMYNMSNLAGDVFINYLINSIMETFGLSAPMLVLDRFGRKKVYCVSIFLGGAACGVCFFPAFFSAPAWVIISLAAIGRFFGCVAFSTLYIYATELFPTVIRATAIGAGMTVARLGGVISPYVADVGLIVGGRLEKALPLIISGTPALLVGIFALFLPETKGTRLPETLDDMKYRKHRCCCGPSEEKSEPDAPGVTADEELKDLNSCPC